MILLKRQCRHGSHNGLRSALKGSSDQDHMNIPGRQTLCMGHGIGHEGSLRLLDEVHHISGRRPGIQVDKVLGLDQRYRILRDLSFLFPIYIHPLRYRRLCCLISAVREYCPAKHLHQFTRLIQHNDISSRGRFGNIQKPCQLSHRHASLFLQNL